MHIALITPAPAGSKAGNRATAERWALLLEGGGHTVSVTDDNESPSLVTCDLLIALHAWRSSNVVARFRAVRPDIPIIVVLTGTDVYDHQYRFPEPTRRSMAHADCLVGLHRLVGQDIPHAYRTKLITVLQSARLPEFRLEKPDGHFQVCVIGHLREEKDSLRAAYATRQLPRTSRIRVWNAGKPHSDNWHALAVQEQASNPRFQWLGELSQADTQALMQRSHLMVISSVMEGGANVVSEACRLGLPILASDIPGNRGLLGDDYPGYFRARDEKGLADLMAKSESSANFLETLTAQVSNLAGAFTPDAEQAALAVALEAAVKNCAHASRSG